MPASTDRDAFVERLVRMLNEAGVALMLSVGSRVGLLDALDASGPVTVEALAGSTGLDARYVREWLAAMATGRIVEYDPATKRYELPAHRAEFLTTRAGVRNLTRQANYLPLLGAVENLVVECFRNGGGVPYEAFTGFHQHLAAQSAAVQDASLLDGALPLVDGLVERLEAGLDVLDVGCGSGHAVNLLAERFPASRVVGVDLAEEALDAARDEAAARGLANASFLRRDAAHLAYDGAFDLVTTFDAVHDQARPDLVLAGIARALRPGGTYLCADIRAHSALEENLDHPLGAWLYTISCMHCMTVSLADGGMGLGTMWGEERALAMLADAGFQGISVHHLDDDPANNYYVASAPS